MNEFTSLSKEVKIIMTRICSYLLGYMKMRLGYIQRIIKVSFTVYGGSVGYLRSDKLKEIGLRMNG